jgi:hypothetical protein
MPEVERRKNFGHAKFIWKKYIAKSSNYTADEILTVDYVCEYCLYFYMQLETTIHNSVNSSLGKKEFIISSFLIVPHQ